MQEKQNHPSERCWKRLSRHNDRFTNKLKALDMPAVISAQLNRVAMTAAGINRSKLGNNESAATFRVALIKAELDQWRQNVADAADIE